MPSLRMASLWMPRQHYAYISECVTYNMPRFLKYILTKWKHIEVRKKTYNPGTFLLKHEDHGNQHCRRKERS